MGALVEDALLVNVAKRPIVVALVYEFIERAGCVVGVAAHSAQPGV